MKKNLIILLLIFAITSSFNNVTSERNFTKTNTSETGFIIGSLSAPAIIKVWEEKPDNSRGNLIYDERWIARDEKLTVNTESGRIIFDYKYSATDTWKTDNHAWCHKNEITKIP
ncbi:MAG TPA: hypothetical protein VK623_09540 [Flavobacterium sp.]|nr:hypothetical protein [Flavobacterium sp.]